MCLPSIWLFLSFNLLYHCRKHFLPITGNFSTWMFDITLKKDLFVSWKKSSGHGTEFSGRELSTTDKSRPHNSFLRVSTAACSEQQHCGVFLKNLHQKPWEREGSLGTRFPEASSPTTAPSSSELKFLTHKKLFVHVRRRSAPSPAPDCLLELLFQLELDQVSETMGQSERTTAKTVILVNH